MKKAFAIIFFILALPFFITTNNVLAQVENNVEFQETEPSDTTPDSRVLTTMERIAGGGGYVTDPTTASAPRIVGLIINALLSITGIIFIILTVFAGYNWMTSEGNEEKIKKSIATLRAAILGLIITLSAWTLWNFIFDRLILGTAG